MKSDYTPHEKKLRHLKARTKARPILKACPKCGSPLVKTREEKLLFWDYYIVFLFINVFLVILM